jgi:hypothetical protein
MIPQKVNPDITHSKTARHLDGVTEVLRQVHQVDSTAPISDRFLPCVESLPLTQQRLKAMYLAFSPFDMCSLGFKMSVNIVSAS